ncbi:MAG: hypothetical protein H6Q73_1478 [Firmicutes bacterium]|nr:hypothetical protein [Bacillota bacterium]
MQRYFVNERRKQVMHKISIIFRQAGSTSIIAIMTMLLAGILLSGVMFAVTATTKNSANNADAINAQNAAEAGIKRALTCFETGKTGGAPDWSWLQTSTIALNNNKVVDTNNNLKYSVLIQLAGTNDPVTAPVCINSSTKNDIVYVLTATGTSRNISRKLTVNVTVQKNTGIKSLPLSFQYVYYTVTGAVKNAKTKKWKRDAGKLYNTESWNGLAELILQENAQAFTSASQLRYDGSTSNPMWGSNWHYGWTKLNYVPGSIADGSIIIDSTYSPNTYSYENFTNHAGWADDSGDESTNPYSASTPAYKDTTSTLFNYYSLLSKYNSLNLWNGEPAVFVTGTDSLNNINRSSSNSYFMPPWVLITASTDFSPANIQAIISSNITDDQKLQALKCILGTIVVYRADTPAASDPSTNPVQVYKVNVDTNPTSSTYKKISLSANSFGTTDANNGVTGQNSNGGYNIEFP